MLATVGFSPGFDKNGILNDVIFIVGFSIQYLYNTSCVDANNESRREDTQKSIYVLSYPCLMCYYVPINIYIGIIIILIICL